MLRRTMMALVAGTALTGFAAASSAETLEWTAGQIGGGWYTQASGMANMLQEANPGLTIKVVPGGGTANPTKVERNISQLGSGLDIFTFAASKGKFNYEGKPHENLQMIGMSFSDIYLHLVAAENAPVKDFEELFTKAENVKIAVTQSGSSDEQTFRYLMAHYGTDYDRLRSERGWKINLLDYAASGSQFADGQVDYVFHALGIPGAAIVEMTQSRDAEILPWPESVQDAMAETYGYTKGSLPAGTYPSAQDGPEPTIIMATTLMVNKDVSEDTVYNITKTLCENSDKLATIHQSMSVFDCATAAKSAPAPIHPGAARYYKEQGYM
ncbi:TAXI family TRAP transporter solute-binding subunit [Geminicoccaceae bacterium 1502E]|nr:TAXI family TRAP transporter solute-binding subunit [Geminicoccaceae bacterium 1502E]